MPRAKPEEAVTKQCEGCTKKTADGKCHIFYAPAHQWMRGPCYGRASEYRWRGYYDDNAPLWLPTGCDSAEDAYKLFNGALRHIKLRRCGACRKLNYYPPQDKPGEWICWNCGQLVAE